MAVAVGESKRIKVTLVERGCRDRIGYLHIRTDRSVLNESVLFLR